MSDSNFFYISNTAASAILHWNSLAKFVIETKLLTYLIVDKYLLTNFVKNVFYHTFCGGFVTFCDLFGTDISFSRRFQVTYLISGIVPDVYLSVNSFPSRSNMMPSLYSLVPALSWPERECWDMFGVFFLNNNSLRRILTDYGFRGYPLRKTFPLTGYLELRYIDSISSIIHSKVVLAQELRFFKFSSLWSET
jgi:NADH-quinone oxidoreductase subunit C